MTPCHPSKVARRERWHPVVGYVGLYEVSDRGRVRSLDRVDSAGRQRRGRYLRGTRDSYGYLHVNLCRDGAPYQTTVHNLVARAFLGAPEPDQEVRHLNGTPANNRVENLAWGTPRENSLDRRMHGTDNRGERHPLARLDDAAVRAIRMGAHGTDIPAVAKLFGVSGTTVRLLVRGKRWSHVDPPKATWAAQPHTKVTAAIVADIRQGRYGTVLSRIAEQLALTVGAVWHIVEGRNWKDVTPQRASWR